MKVAIDSFSLPIVKYLVSKGYPITGDLIEYAKQKKYVEIADFLKSMISK